MRYIKYLFEEKYNNWVRYTPESLKSDFSEYKKKEDSKWKSRAKSMGFRFPIFDSIEDFQKALDNAKVKTLTQQEAMKIGNVALNDTIEDVKDMVSIYKRPRDVDRIVKGFSSKSKIPMPIELKGSHGIFKLAGNTRLNIAFIMGIIPEVLIVDVTK
jgi:hypothetical protein